jgi:hypothetical protein
VSVKLNSSGGGSITLQEPSTASNRTLTLPDNTGNLISSADSGTITQGMLASGVAGNGPAFSAYGNATQSFAANTWTKVAYNLETFDTANCYDNSLYRFTPNVAGYYQFNAVFFMGSQTGNAIASLYKNGALYMYGNAINLSNGPICNVSGLIYLNGTTDYAEAYAVQSSSVTVTGGTNAFGLNFQGFLARAA